MASRANRMRDNNQVAKLVKDLCKRMDDFQTSVEELKIMKDTIADMNDEVYVKEQETKARLRQLSEELQDNTVKALNDGASKLGKLIISKDEWNELNGLVTKLKGKNDKLREEYESEVEGKVQERVTQQMEIVKLEHQRDLASLKASNDNYLREIDNMRSNFDRLSGELESQKRLTAEIASAGKPSPKQSTSPSA